MFSGIYQILHTPFDDAGAIDWASHERQIQYCLDVGVHGLAVPAMASEFFTLSDQERFEIVEFTLKAVNRRVPVLVGAQAVSQPVAMSFAEHAAQHGADGLLAMPPYLRKASKADVGRYYQALASVGLPVMIQNAPAPVGTPLSPPELTELLQQEAKISYVKEETTPILQRISRIHGLAGAACLGIFGGANGLYLLDELRRGAVGNMPGGGFVDVQVKIYNRYIAGDTSGAEALQERLLSLLSYAAVYGVVFHKYLLWRRGVLQSPYARDPQQLPLDDEDKRAIERYWQRVADDAADDYPLEAGS
ncbi:MAG: hypothetical protein CL610_21975 [Anaerolineaceae bacterium]|nr:hypothetical protein [Anaerolineaceae bacterium]